VGVDCDVREARRVRSRPPGALTHLSFADGGKKLNRARRKYNAPTEDEKFFIKLKNTRPDENGPRSSDDRGRIWTFHAPGQHILADLP